MSEQAWERACRQHGKACSYDEDDHVICPVGPHRLQSHEWAVVKAGEARTAGSKPLEGDALVRDHALKALTRAKNDPAVAVAYLMTEAEENTGLYMALLDSFLGNAAWKAIREAAGKTALQMPPKESFVQRGKATLHAPPPRRDSPPRAPKRPPTRGLELVGETNLRGLLAYQLPIPRGPKLGDATRDQVLEAVAENSSRARKAVVRGRWLHLVADKTPGGRLVKDVLTAKALDELQGVAEREMAQLRMRMQTALSNSGPVPELES